MRTLEELIPKYDNIQLIIDEGFIDSFVDECNRNGLRTSLMN